MCCMQKEINRLRGLVHAERDHPHLPQNVTKMPIGAKISRTFTSAVFIVSLTSAGSNVLAESYEQTTKSVAFRAWIPL